jgi:sRNA-binding regulator protein Hfq
MPLPPDRSIKAKSPAAKAAPSAKAKSRPPEQTFEEPKYLRRLIEHAVPVRVKLSNNEEISGTIEFYDANFIRLTRANGPNLFIFKHDIKYLYEEST